MKFLHNLSKKKKEKKKRLLCIALRTPAWLMNLFLPPRSFLLPSFFQGPVCEPLHRDALRRGRERGHQRRSQPIGQSRFRRKRNTSRLVCFVSSDPDVMGAGDDRPNILAALAHRIIGQLFIVNLLITVFGSQKAVGAWMGFLPL